LYGKKPYNQKKEKKKKGKESATKATPALTADPPRTMRSAAAHTTPTSQPRTETKAKKGKSQTTEAAAHPKKPMSAFLLYTNHKRPEIKKIFPGTHPF
jgi:hypothetical protein